MTETEIMKALECCAKPHCNSSGCPMYKNTINTKDCITKMSENALDLINRKNAEIEELQHEKTELQHKIEKLNFENLQMVASIKGLEARAIKEFAERVKEVAYPLKFVFFNEIDQIAKEMGVEL